MMLSQKIEVGFKIKTARRIFARHVHKIVPRVRAGEINGLERAIRIFCAVREVTRVRWMNAQGSGGRSGDQGRHGQNERGCGEADVSDRSLYGTLHTRVLGPRKMG